MLLKATVLIFVTLEACIVSNVTRFHIHIPELRHGVRFRCCLTITIRTPATRTENNKDKQPRWVSVPHG